MESIMSLKVDISRYSDSDHRFWPWGAFIFYVLRGSGLISPWVTWMTENPNQTPQNAIV